MTVILGYDWQKARPEIVEHTRAAARHEAGALLEGLACYAHAQATIDALRPELDQVQAHAAELDQARATIRAALADLDRESDPARATQDTIRATERARASLRGRLGGLDREWQRAADVARHLSHAMRDLGEIERPTLPAWFAGAMREALGEVTPEPSGAPLR